MRNHNSLLIYPHAITWHVNITLEKKFTNQSDIAIVLNDEIQVLYGAPNALSFEHFLPWIWKLMLFYQDQNNDNDEEMLPQGASYSKTKRYYNKKIN